MAILKSFSKPELLKRVRAAHLIELLGGYRPDLARLGVVLPEPGGEDSLDYMALANVFMNPDQGVPHKLLDALFIINDLSTTTGMDALRAAWPTPEFPGGESEDHSPADAAVRCWLLNRPLVERVHARQRLRKTRSFEAFRPRSAGGSQLMEPSNEVLTAMALELDVWFVRNDRGGGSKVFAFPKAGATWFLVRHGDTVKRDGAMVENKPSNVVYRPEVFDVIMYEQVTGELRMKAASKREMDLYREVFGRHLFGDASYFALSSDYTLEPLRTLGVKALRCDDIEGLESVTLRQIVFMWPGANAEVEIRKANDVFAIARRFPKRPKIVRATFEVEFSDSTTRRMVTIQLPRRSQLLRDNDSPIVEEWLREREFIMKRAK